ncbi:MAG TPA: NAD(P)-dependent alcohol dehydrogenase [Streptosporangiaceae bacterium]|nr:NAD(P)-dependent alcohol dehydrogenase [Streptosporangiaceae bacterium]
MKAAVHTRYGPPEVVKILDVPKPVANRDQLLVKVHATTVNQTDCHYRAAQPFVMRFLSGLRRPRATVLGNEFAGEVEAVGEDVTAFSVGDRVFGYCEGQFGAHAEYIAVGQRSPVATMPANVSYEQAAPATEAAHYALSHINAAKISAGHSVLVYGATGGIGSAAVQLLKSVGAYVTAVCATPHLELVRGLGPDKVVDYTAGDFAVDDRKYDVVFDAVGKSTFGRCKPLLKPRGIYMSTGPGPAYINIVLPLATPLLRGKKVVFSFPRIDQQMVERFRDLIEAGKFKPVLDRQYPLEQIVEAYQYTETGQKVGNVVISLD